MIKNKQLLCLLVSCISSSVGAVDFDLGDNVSITVKGKLHYDAAVIDDGLDKQQDSQIRRAKVSATAKLGKDVRAKLEYELKDGTMKVEDAYIEYKGFDQTSIKAGNISAIAGLEGSSSSSHLPFMERSPTDELLPDRGVGVQIKTYNDNWTISASVTGDKIKSLDEFKEKVSTKEVITARATAVLFKEKDNLLHIGGTLSRTDPRGQSVAFSTRAGSRLSNIVARTGTLNNIDNQFTEGLEVAWSQGGLLLQGEYLRTQLNHKDHTQNNIDGWYASAAYALSGAPHKYNTKKGVFFSPEANKHATNIELVARISELNLGAATDSKRTVKSKTIGANYYVDDTTRVMLNYDWTDVESEKQPETNTTKALQARIQKTFY